MSRKYKYYWDSSNKKKVYGGKYGNNDAGDYHELIRKTWGDQRHFVGSGKEEYDFINRKLGILLTVRADSWEEAKRIARSMGFTQIRRPRT